MSNSAADRAAQDELLASLQRRNDEISNGDREGNGGGGNEAAAADFSNISKNKDETVSNVLLSMLDGEVHRLKTIERSQQDGMERKDRDNKRMAVMLSMSHDQLEHYTARNAKLHEEVTSKSEELRKAESTIEELKKEVHSLNEDKRAIRTLQAENETSAQNALVKQTTEVKILRDSLKSAEAERAAIRQSAEEERELAQAESRKAFELRVALETRVRSLEEEARFLNDMRAKETKSATSKEYDLAIKVRQQGLELADLTAQLESNRRQTLDTHTALKTENSALEAQVRRLERDLREAQQSALESTTQMTIRIKQLSEENESLLIASKSRERVLESQTAKLTTDLLSTQTQLTSEELRGSDQSKASTLREIELNAARNAAEQRLANTLQEIDVLKNKLEVQEVAAHAAAQGHTRAIGNLDRQHTTTLTSIKCDLDATQNDLKWKTEQLEKAEARVQELMSEITQLKNSHIAEVSALKTEVGGYQHAVKVLDTHIQENHENNILVQKLKVYEGQIEHLKNQLVSSNSAIANTRVESDIADTYRVELLRDQIEADSHRRSVLERERQSARQLLDVLIPYYNDHQAKLLTANTNNNTSTISPSTTAGDLTSSPSRGGVGNGSGANNNTNTNNNGTPLLVNASAAAASVEERQLRALAGVAKRSGTVGLVAGGGGGDSNEDGHHLLDVAAAARLINSYYRTYGGP